LVGTWKKRCEFSEVWSWCDSTEQERVDLSALLGRAHGTNWNVHLGCQVDPMRHLSICVEKMTLYMQKDQRMWINEEESCGENPHKKRFFYIYKVVVVQEWSFLPSFLSLFQSDEGTWAAQSVPSSVGGIMYISVSALLLSPRSYPSLSCKLAS
jgi:hypothetical protein